MKKFIKALSNTKLKFRIKASTQYTEHEVNSDVRKLELEGKIATSIVQSLKKI